MARPSLSPLRPVLGALVVVLGFGLVSDDRTEDDSSGAVETFESRPDLSPPALTVDETSPGLGAAHMFVAPWRGEHQAGPMILDNRGRMVWFHPMDGKRAAMDFRVQRYQGGPVLTWWEGRFVQDGYGLGDYVVADASYREIARFRTSGNRPGDFHEYLLTPRGTALITIYREVPHDLSAVGGPANGTLIESIVEEIDVASGRTLFTWRASDHVDLAESHEPAPSKPGEPFDFFHINSVDVDDDGNLLLSARHTDAVYKIDRETGEVIWRLGGTRSDFEMGIGARFFSQHDARRRPDGSITLFDNGTPPQRHQRSRAIALRLDPTSMTANVEHRVAHPSDLLSESQGNAQLLPGGSMFLGWGSMPYFSEFGPRGALRFDAHFPDGSNIYRAYRGPWTAQPTTRPAVVAESVDDGVTVHASWNGATEVSRWQVLAGARPSSLRPVLSVPWRGFETEIDVPTGPSYLAVRALGRSGTTLSTSRVVAASE